MQNTPNTSRHQFLDLFVQGTVGGVAIPELTEEVANARAKLIEESDRKLDELAEARRLSWQDAQSIYLD